MLASAGVTGLRGRSPSTQHAPSLCCHPLPAHKQVLTGRSFQLRKDLIILGIYLRRFQNPRGDSDADWGKTCVFVSILHHRSSGAGGRIEGCKWAYWMDCRGGIVGGKKVECMTVRAGLQGCFLGRLVHHQKDLPYTSQHNHDPTGCPPVHHH